jgi:hypothetical protein
MTHPGGGLARISAALHARGAAAIDDEGLRVLD